MPPRGQSPSSSWKTWFDGFAEDPGDLQCQYRRGDEAPGLDGVYGLAAYADGIGQLLLGHAYFGAFDSNPILHRGAFC